MQKVSVCILCYNYGQYLPKAIESCLQQEKGNYEMEIIVIDDGSTDNTPAVCEKYRAYIKCYRSENEGFAASLTKSVQYATGEIVCLLDADDYFLPNKIKTVVETFENNSSLLFLYHDKAYVDENDKIIVPYTGGGSTSSQVFNRTAALVLLPAYNEQFFYTIFLAGRGLHLQKELCHYRKHSSNMSHPKSLMQWKVSLKKMNILHLAKLKNLIHQPPFWGDSSIMRSIYCKIAANYNYILSEIALQENKRMYAFRCFLRSILWDVRSGTINLNTLKVGVSYFVLRRPIKG